VAVIVAVLAAPATAAGTPPAVDQYTVHLPAAGGGPGPAGGEIPVARPGLLPGEILAALSGPDGRLLARIATARDLGAPRFTSSAGLGTQNGASENGFATVVADTIGTAPALALFGALAGIGLAGGWTRFTRRYSATDL
jgi:hypothetical protein